MPRPPLMENDKELNSLETMVPTMSTLSMLNTNQNTTPPSSRTYEPEGLVENHDNFFHGYLAPDQSMQNGNNNDTNDDNSFCVKRAIAPSQFLNESGSAGSSFSTKRFHGDLNSGSSNTEENNNNSFVSLLSQLPQSASFHANAILESVEDGVMRQQFQLPNINWN